MSQVQVEDQSDHHVRFDTANLKDDFESDSCVTYQRSGDTIIISLGFLQINHRYLIDLKFPLTLFENIGTKPGGQFVPDITTVPNLHCRITEFSGLKHDDEHDFYEMKIEFFAYKEKLLREVLHIVNSNNSKEVLKLIMVARVLGKGKGTPMLRSGIHCIGVEKDDDESEASDFPGFDHHVRFDTANLKDDFESDSCVTYQRSGDTIIISLGFLQINHRYLIDLKFPLTLFENIGTKPGGQFVPDITTVPNLHCRITEFSGLKHDDERDFYEMKIEFFAYKEKLLREVLHIVNSNNSKEVLKLMMVARVLGKGKGTPMLRSGIHCIGEEKDDDESEASDFPGFGKGT
ncbi:uncharacterized protein [Eurosta solidaginis]|uniref:uncharacterized protein n=1 Tax=Eurosta solidaginis TaxID=178769 RepID=UPI003530F374